MHRKYAESWGVDLEAVVPSPATRAYTDFLMEVAEDHTTVRCCTTGQLPGNLTPHVMYALHRCTASITAVQGLLPGPHMRAQQQCSVCPPAAAQPHTQG